LSTSNYSDVSLRLSVLDDRFAVCRLEPDEEVPNWAVKDGFLSVTRTPDELSIVCPERNIPAEVRCEEGWRVFGTEGPLDFSLVGILASLLDPLAKAGISVFALSTYDTDYVLVREDVLGAAVAVLRESGHEVLDASANIVVRPLRSEDEGFLQEMLYEAVYWEPEESGEKPSPDKLLAEPGLRHYLADWGREGDLAVIAQDDKDGRKVGAAWCRLFPSSDPGYGFVDATTPDIVIAVSPDWRGIGVGGTLLRALIEAARSNGFEALSLSAQKNNKAAVALYEKNSSFGLRDDGDAWVMKADLTTDTATDNV
jgi:ribosomal protein S18 acetylase RimI-like enzyme